jgi:hypothetical protein
MLTVRASLLWLPFPDLSSTTWPCFTEAMYFLGDLKGWKGQQALWQFIERGLCAFTFRQMAKLNG